MKFPKFVLLALSLGAAFASGADDDWFRGRLFAPEVVLRNATALKLTDGQRKIIRQEIVKVQSTVAGIDVEMMEEGLAIQEAIDKLPVDRADVLARADKVFAAESRKKRAWIEMLVNIKNALTPAQVDSLRAIAGAEPKP
jgi:Spy/CpxP family protein refolding chaperone